MGGLGLYWVRKRAASDYRLRLKAGKLRFEVFQRPVKAPLEHMPDAAMSPVMPLGVSFSTKVINQLK